MCPPLKTLDFGDQNFTVATILQTRQLVEKLSLERCTAILLGQSDYSTCDKLEYHAGGVHVAIAKCTYTVDCTQTLSYAFKNVK